MVNKMFSNGHGLAANATRQVRSAGFVEENADGDATRLADLRVVSFDNLLLAFDLEHVRNDHMAELVSTAISGTDSFHLSVDSSVQRSGPNGYRIQWPGAKEAGFAEADKISMQTVPGLLYTKPFDVDSVGTESGQNLFADLRVIRTEQLGYDE